MQNYSKIVNRRLNEDKNNDSILYEIYHDLNLRIKYTEEPLIYKKVKVRDQDSILDTKFRLYFIDYLNLASRMKDDYRRLVNNSISEGYVFIQTVDLNRLIQEYVRMKILDIRNIDDIKDGLLKNQTFKKIFEEIQEIWEEKGDNFETIIETGYQEGKDNKKDLPPCIQEILSKLEEGQNLVHNERLSLVWFLDDILIFVYMPLGITLIFERR